MTVSLLVALFAAFPLSTAADEPQPGTNPNTTTPEVSALASGSLSPVVVEIGKLSLSVDGVGENTGSGTVEIDKPAGATVHAAYLAAASTGFTNHQIGDGDVAIDGTAVNWDQSIASSIESWNCWADVTSLVSTKLDGAAAGPVTFTISETSTHHIDGEILAVIWDDPNQTTDNTIALLFGAQNVAGDTFTFNFADPIDKGNPNQSLTMSLGISYSWQRSGQYSIVDVNGQRLTTSAGGQDDGYDEDGTLLTVGGVGDSADNPANPNALPSGPRSDDELYDLGPFTTDGDTSITVFTQNPSNDDNIFFAAFDLADIRATIDNHPPEIAADRASVTVAEGQTATMTGTVSDPDGDAVTVSASVGAVVNNGDGTWSWSFPTTDGPTENQTVTVTADDGNGGISTATFALVVTNVAPAVGPISGPTGPNLVNTSLSFNSPFSDPGTSDTHTASWDWGDGATSAGAVGAGSVSGTHAYAHAGLYTVALTVTDDDGGAGTATYQHVIVVDPDAGSLFGAGDLDSPAGAWVVKPDLACQASFRVMATYDWSTTGKPVGNFSFTLGGSSRTTPAFTFRATGFDWLVIDGDTAWLAGRGSIDSRGEYSFLLTATDGPWFSGADGVRVRIWETATGTVVYDNLMSEPEISTATQTLRRGTITIAR